MKTLSYTLVTVVSKHLEYRARDCQDPKAGLPTQIVIIEAVVSPSVYQLLSHQIPTALTVTLDDTSIHTVC